MIPFLIKLANLLDRRGQYSMAREVDDLVDDLIVKMAEIPSVTQSWFDAHKTLVQLLDSLQDLMEDNPIKGEETIVKFLDSYITQIRTLLERANKNQLSPEAITWHINAWNKFKSFVPRVYKNHGVAVPKDYQALDSKINQNADAIISGLAGTPGVANKAPARSGGNIIKLVQKAIGVSDADGKWTPETSKAFIAYMNSNFPSAMKDNVFAGILLDDKGTRGSNKLKDAWELISKGRVAQKRAPEMYGHELGPEAEVPQQDVASKAPAAPKAWKSKHFKITPAAQNSLQAIEKIWPGTAQQEIDKLDSQKEVGTAGKHMDQSIFEEMLAGRAKPAK